MSITYWLNFEDMERCFLIYRKGTVFEKEPAYITAYEACKGLNEYYASEDNGRIPLRDARTGIRFSECATRGVIGSIDKMITWLREKHDIFYTPAMNLCIPLEDPLSRSVKKFWEEEDAQQKQIEEYCKNDPACGLSLKKLHNQYVAHHVPPVTYSFPLDKPVGRVTNVHIGQPGEGIRIDIELFDKQRLEKERDELKEERDNLKEERDNLVKRLEEIDEYGYGGYACSGCKRTTCGYFTEILSSLGVKNAVVYPPRGQSKVECFAKLANERAHVVFKENQTLTQQVDAFSKIADEYKDKIKSLKRVISGLNIRVHNQSSIIKTQNESLAKQDKQLKDLGVALSNVKNTVDCEMDDLMKTHGDDIIPIF